MSVSYSNNFVISLYPGMAENEILEAIERAIAATLILDKYCPIEKLGDIEDEMAIFSPDKNGGMTNVAIITYRKHWYGREAGLFGKCLSEELKCRVDYMSYADCDDEISACVWREGRCLRQQGDAIDWHDQSAAWSEHD